MKITATSNTALGQSELMFETNCHTDSLPLLKRVLFRRIRLNMTCQGAALAAAILVRNSCGDYFDLPHLPVGGDYADAIRILLGDNVNITPVNPLYRNLATHDISVVCGPAANHHVLAKVAALSKSTPLASVTWSGDFVDPQTRNSHDSEIGMCLTNAAHFTDTTSVSVALALMFAEDHAGRIFVPEPPEAMNRDHQQLVDSLRTIAVSLEFVEQISTPSRSQHI